MQITEIISQFPFSGGKEINTKRGPRYVTECRWTPELDALYTQHRKALYDEGISVSEWQGKKKFSHWQEIGAERKAQKAAAIESSRAADATIEIPCPDGLAYLPYQRGGIAYGMARKAVLIGDEMGLGKTIQAIGIINATPDARRVLVVCPASLKLNWVREIRKWRTNPDLTVELADGKTFPEASVVVINYDVLSKHTKGALSQEFDIAIFDEAHYCKNGKAARTKAAFGDRKTNWPGIRAKRRILLTGTPLTNRPVELFSLLNYLDPARWPSVFSFGKRYCAGFQGGWGWDFTGSSNLEELQNIMRETVMVRRLKADVLTELPPKRRQIVHLARNGAAKAVEAEQRAYEAGQERREHLALAVELSKASSDPADYAAAVEAMGEAAKAAFAEISKLRHDTALAKVPYVIEHALAAAAEAPIVIFAHHKDVLSQIKEGLTAEGHRCVSVTGDDAITDRQASVDTFQRGEAQVILGTLGAMAVGHTLTRSAHVIFAELDWVPANVSQAEDRTHRIGQEQRVLIQHLVFDGSLDARMAEILVEKQEIIDRAMDRVTQPEDQMTLLPEPKKEEAATKSTKRADLDEIAAKLTPEKIAEIHGALQRLAGMCDGAASIDGSGFNKMDTRLGKELAWTASLTPRQAALGYIVARKYHRQIGKIELP